MCWCWSEHPYHRPAIKEVLTVLEDGVTSQLVSAFPIMSNTTGMVVSASVIHAPKVQPFSRISGYLHQIGSTKPCKTPAMDIWCACKDVLKRVSCQAFHCDVEVCLSLTCNCINMQSLHVCMLYVCNYSIYNVI